MEARRDEKHQRVLNPFAAKACQCLDVLPANAQNTSVGAVKKGPIFVGKWSCGEFFEGHSSVYPRLDGTTMSAARQKLVHFWLGLAIVHGFPNAHPNVNQPQPSDQAANKAVHC